MTREEHDCIGSLNVPNAAYYGCQTLRGKQNYEFTGIPISHYPDFINAFAHIKKATVITNHDLGLIGEERKNAIVKACEDILAGRYHDQFIIDLMQGGAGTSCNMNANEVIANIANEYLGHAKGDYTGIHPNNHVNMSQSTNDAYPTALKLALYFMLNRLQKGMEELKSAFDQKGDEFADIIKMGRTQLQDAVPMTLGQEFSAWGTMLGEDLLRVTEAQALLREINLGATAIGTGINAPQGFAAKVTEALSRTAGVECILSPNLVEATQDTGVYVQLSGVLKRVAVKISKICNDLRLLSSGPRCGFNEINLPRMAPGSSIMPGKVNPVIPEVVNQVAFRVIGSDVTVSLAAEAGQLELNVMEPVIALCLFENIHLLERACKTLAEKCVLGITANRERCEEYVTGSIGIVTVLCPHIGYERSTQIALEALQQNRNVIELVKEKNLIDEELLDKIMQPAYMIAPQNFLNLKAQPA